MLVLLIINKLFDIIISFRVGKGPQIIYFPPNADFASSTLLAVGYVAVEHHSESHKDSKFSF